MSKIGKFVSAEENDIIVNEMLRGNEIIEETLAKWKEDTQDVGYIAAAYKSIIDRDRECGGFIVSVESGNVPAGADHVEFFNGGKPLKLNKAKGSYDDRYLLVFTTRDRFRECNDTAGVVMFIREAFSLLRDIEGVDGIVINIGKEEVVINKHDMKVISRLIELSEEKEKEND